MTLAEALAHPATLPLGILAGVALGAALSYPIAYLNGKCAAQNDQIDANAALRDKWMRSTGLRSPAGAE